MRPILAVSIHDGSGKVVDKFIEASGILKEIFETVIVGITPNARDSVNNRLERLKDNDGVRLVFNDDNTQLGDHFQAIIREALKAAKDEDTIHIATPDRVSLAAIKFGEQFKKDIEWVDKQGRPVMFVRSEVAWQSHPQNYMAIERAGNIMGAAITGKTVDWFWCQIAINKKKLESIVEQVKCKDSRMLGEIVLPIKDEVVTKGVDWLAWEDPFILGIDEKTLKKELEASVDESKKRLGYVLPMVELLMERATG